MTVPCRRRKPRPARCCWISAKIACPRNAPPRGAGICTAWFHPAPALPGSARQNGACSGNPSPLPRWPGPTGHTTVADRRDATSIPDPPAADPGHSPPHKNRRYPRHQFRPRQQLLHLGQKGVAAGAENGMVGRQQGQGSSHKLDTEERCKASKSSPSLPQQRPCGQIPEPCNTGLQPCFYQGILRYISPKLIMVLGYPLLRC